MRGLRDLAPVVAVGRMGSKHVAAFERFPRDGGLRAMLADYSRAFGVAAATCPELIPTQALQLPAP